MIKLEIIQLPYRTMKTSSQNCQIRLVTKIIFVMLLACCGTSACCGQGPNGDQKTELGIRQQLVKRKMIELEKKFMVVADRIRDEKPQRAELLVKAYQKSKEESLTRKMDMVSELLNEKKHDEAEQQLDEVVGILESLIRLLTNEKEKEVSAREEMEKLEQIKQKIKQQLEEQQKQTRETEKASNKDVAAEKVAAQIAALKGLIEKQSELIKETGENSKAQLNQLDKLADKQFEVRKATDELNKNITGEKNSLNKDGSFKEMPDPVPGASPPKSDQEAKGKGSKGERSKEESSKGENSKPSDSGEPSDPADGDQPPSDPAKSGDDQKSQQNPKGEQNPDGKPSDGKGSQGKSGSGEPQQGQPSESGNSDPSGSEEGGQQSPKAPPQPGQKALEKAADHQKRAEEKLGSGKPTDAKRQQQQAFDEMKDALSELEKEKRRIESLPPEVLEQLAREQRRSRDKTLDLIEEMKEAPKTKSDDGDQGQQSQAPGQQKMNEAQQAQDGAAEKMENGDSEGAQEEQKHAEEKMKEALEEVEDRLSQLREETNEEKLARLEARFQEMLDRQKEASALTIEIEDKRANLGIIHHRDQLLILRLATEELEIRELAQQAYDLLLEDGTSIVFPEVVQDIRGDLQSAATLLQEDKTDQFTQLVQKEIETGVADLLDALKKSQEKKDGGGGGGGQGGKQPLLKQSAELKILRMRQRRLNRRTSKLEMMKDQQGLQQKIKSEIDSAAQMQAKILEMTENIMNKQQ